MKRRTLLFKRIGLLLLTLSIGFFSCSGKEKAEQAERSIITSGPEFKSTSAEVHLPYLFVSQDKMYISWIESEQGYHQFYWSSLEEQSLGEKELIAGGENWFVNWADYPQVNAFKDGSLMATYLKKSGPGTFSYDIWYAVRQDQGNWTEPKVLHDDQTQTEHGFVSMSPWKENMLVTWLDGRYTVSHSSHNHHTHQHQGQMTLRAALVNNTGEKLNEWLLDDRVCDCCQTASAITDLGPVVIFRDRSENEIRDIGFQRWEEDQWSPSQPVYMDLWEIAACPVNGPRISTYKQHLAIAWFTAAKGQAEVKVIFSEDQGKTMSAPVLCDLGNPIGRVAIEMLNEEVAFLVWMEDQRILGRTVSTSGKLGRPLEIAKSSENRSSGFPQLKKTANKLWLAWTDDSEEAKLIKTASINLDELSFP
ncbi:MAG: exo-alpha-sialidase [Cecembia sp.]